MVLRNADTMTIMVRAHAIIAIAYDRSWARGTGPKETRNASAYAVDDSSWKGGKGGKKGTKGYKGGKGQPKGQWYDSYKDPNAMWHDAQWHEAVEYGANAQLRKMDYELNGSSSRPSAEPSVSSGSALSVEDIANRWKQNSGSSAPFQLPGRR